MNQHRTDLSGLDLDDHLPPATLVSQARQSKVNSPAKQTKLAYSKKRPRLSKFDLEA